jgi:hypothetical protein
MQKAPDLGAFQFATSLNVANGLRFLVFLGSS